MESLIGFRPKNLTPYKQAFCHKSHNKFLNNERLEFLGDAVLDSIVSEHLYFKYPKEEGVLSKKRAKIVGRKHLNMLGVELIDKSKIKSNLKNIPDNIFGNTLEAIVGAIYVDQGFDQTKRFVEKKIINSKLLKHFEETDYKGDLQSIIQKNKQKIEYKLIKKEGPDHCRVFFVAVFVDNVKIIQSEASSIKEAEQKAAKETLKSYFSKNEKTLYIRGC